MDRMKKIVSDELFEWMKEIRRRIHQWPEKAFEEFKTAELISGHLRQLGIDHDTGISGTGIVGRIVVNKRAPTIALRADMDALPVQEKTGLTFSSRNPGVMHACGHDGHVAILLGAARLLKENPPEGNVVFLFQPAEEGEGGAKRMIEEGALEGVDVIFGGHIETHFRVGEVGVKTGIHTAYTDSFDIEITGKGGHAARPHEAIDAVLIASQVVTHLQTIISRETDPLSPSVISIGFIQAGTAYNVIAERAVLRGTIRTIEESVRSQLIDRIKDIASALSSLHKARIDVRIKPGYPPAINHDRECRFASDVARMLLGEEGFISIPLPSLGGEDFAYYTQKVPGCFLRFGAAKDGYKQGDFHSPEFDFDEEVLRVGAAFMSELVRHAIKRLKKGEGHEE